MNGKQLFEMYLTEKRNGETYELLPLLPIATVTEEEVYRIVEQIHYNGKKLVAFYPGEDNQEPKGECIGEIDDGALYLV